MKANPGGQLAPHEVIGRDALIARLWRLLSKRSVVLTAERRIGKTSVLNKMRVEGQAGLLIIYRDIEGLTHPLEFVDAVYRDVQQHLSGSQKVANRFRRGLEKLAGVEIASLVKLPDTIRSDWKVLLNDLMDDLAEHGEEDIVFFWDEMPLMLYKFKKQHGESTAIDVLDCLRAVRQRHAKIRMVFTGSIGLHYVLTALKRAGSANAPINDMQFQEITTLDPEDGEGLARALIEGEGIRVTDVETVSREIASAVDNFPFYIHHIVDEMTNEDIEYDVDHVRRIVESQLRDGADPWHLRHYRERIGTYYDGEEETFALALLDILSAEEKPLSFAALFDRLKAGVVTENVEGVREVLMLLRRDHYVVIDDRGEYRFRFPLIRRWWRIERGIA